MAETEKRIREHFESSEVNRSKRVFEYFKSSKVDRLLVKLKKDYEESVAVYKFLCQRYDSGNGVSDPLFQWTYCRFYGFRGKMLKRDAKEEYFDVMKKQKGKKMTLKEVLEGLAEHRNQFSFATKLMHTVNNEKPIWDGNVAKIIKIEKLGIEKTKEDYKELEKIYKYKRLEEIYESLLKDEQCKDAIKEFKNRFKDSREISDQKIIDFLLWGFGRLEKKAETQE